MTRGAPLLAAILISFPSSRIESPGLARSPSFATLPRTVTRPAVIQVSISRRDPNPAAASNFCSRSPAGLPELGGVAGGRRVGFVGGLVGRRLRGRGLKLERAGDLLERRQFLQREQSQVVKERLRRGIERGTK